MTYSTPPDPERITPTWGHVAPREGRDAQATRPRIRLVPTDGHPGWPATINFAGDGQTMSWRATVEGDLRAHLGATVEVRVDVAAGVWFGTGRVAEVTVDRAGFDRAPVVQTVIEGVGAPRSPAEDYAQGATGDPA